MCFSLLSVSGFGFGCELSIDLVHKARYQTSCPFYFHWRRHNLVGHRRDARENGSGQTLLVSRIVQCPQRVYGRLGYLLDFMLELATRFARRVHEARKRRVKYDPPERVQRLIGVVCDAIATKQRSQSIVNFRRNHDDVPVRHIF